MIIFHFIGGKLFILRLPDRPLFVQSEDPAHPTEMIPRAWRGHQRFDSFVRVQPPLAAQSLALHSRRNTLLACVQLSQGHDAHRRAKATVSPKSRGRCREPQSHHAEDSSEMLVAAPGGPTSGYLWG